LAPCTEPSVDDAVLVVVMMCLLNLNLVSLYARQGEARAGRKRY
jgi:hypothetical protein